MNGTCPFASQWRRSKDDTTPTTSPPELRDVDQVYNFSRKCPVLSFGELGDGGASCPLGFGSGSAKTESTLSLPRSGLPRMSSAALATHHEQDVDLRLVAIKGVVFDVSGDIEFKAGGALERLPGHDASRFVGMFDPRASSVDDLDSDVFHSLDAGLEGLTYEEHQKLETYYLKMLRGRRAVAVLADDDPTRIFGAPLDGEPNAVAHQTLPVATALHASVERGDVESVRQLLRLHEEGKRPERVADGITGAPPFVCSEDKGTLLVDALCPRTGMTPLLKAVEGAAGDVVRALLEAGADVRPKAILYDNDDAIALARRLGSREDIISLLLPHYAA